MTNTSSVVYTTYMKAEAIKGLRKKLKMTQQNLADKLGVHRITVVNWEKGEARPSPLARRGLARLAKKVEK